MGAPLLGWYGDDFTGATDTLAVLTQAGLRAMYLDGGKRDEWYLELGALAFRDALADIGVTDVACELFDAAHGGIDYRYPRGIGYLAERLAPA